LFCWRRTVAAVCRNTTILDSSSTVGMAFTALPFSQPRGFVDVAIDRARQLLPRIVRERMILPRHPPQTACLPEQPFEYLHPVTRVPRQSASGLGGKLEQDRAGRENPYRRVTVARPGVENGRHAVVGEIFRKSGLNASPLPMLTATIR
jgi:hypothetical protein